MIHEGPLLEYGGRDLAFCSGPPPSATGWCSCWPRRSCCRTPASLVAARAAAVVLLVLCAALALVETLVAKLRILLVPRLLAVGAGVRAARRRRAAPGDDVSGGFVWLLVALGLVAVVARHRTIAVGVVTAQALVLVVVRCGEAARERSPPRSRSAARARPGRALPRRRRPHARAGPFRSNARPLVRGGLAVGLALALTWLVPDVGLTSRVAERGVLALIAFGIVTVATRRATLLQVIGIVLVENGLALAALGLPGASSLVIESASRSTSSLIAVVAAIFHERIFAEFGAGDTTSLRSLRDWRIARRWWRRWRPRAVARRASRRTVPSNRRAARLASAGVLAARAGGARGRRADAPVGTWISSTRQEGCSSGSSASSASRACSPRPRTWRSLHDGAPSRRATYFVLLYAFWALLLAVPLAGNLGGAWLLVAATTAPRRSRRLRRASREPGGGLEVPDPHLARPRRGAARNRPARGGLPGGLDGLDWRGLASSRRCRRRARRVPAAPCRLAAKIGWAPVHNWLPDAHAEAPSPVSALLSAALLPDVLLVAWRSQQALAPVIGSAPRRRR